MSEEPTSNPPQAAPKNNLGIPIAIVIAAGFISAAIYFSGKDTAQPNTITGTNTGQLEQTTPEVETVPIQETDHIRGNPNAPITLIEYSDFDCPFCKRFHEAVMVPLINEYGPSGEMSWVYRHLPLASLHPNAPLLAAASECVAEEAGNEGFWTFADLVFGERETNAQTDTTRLPDFAVTAGADRANFEACLASGKYDEAVADSIDEAIAANGGPSRLGTPFTLVFVGSEYIGPIVGAQEYSEVKRNIDLILGQIEENQGAAPEAE